MSSTMEIFCAICFIAATVCRDGLAAVAGLGAGLGGHAVGDARVVAVLRDGGRHHVDRCGGLLHRGRLLAGGLRQALRRRADLPGGAREGVDRRAHVADDLGQPAAVALASSRTLGEHALAVALDALSEVALGQAGEDAHDVVEHRLGGLDEAVDAQAQRAHFVGQALQRDALSEVARGRGVGHLLCRLHRLLQHALHAHLGVTSVAILMTLATRPISSVTGA
jgi:hypothetical protein